MVNAINQQTKPVGVTNRTALTTTELDRYTHYQKLGKKFVHFSLKGHAYQVPLRNFISMLVIGVVSLGLVASLYATGQVQNLLPKAAGNCRVQCNCGGGSFCGDGQGAGVTKTCGQICSGNQVAAKPAATNSPAAINNPGSTTGTAGSATGTTPAKGCDNGVPDKGTACKSDGEKVQYRCHNGVFVAESCGSGLACHGTSCTSSGGTTGSVVTTPSTPSTQCSPNSPTATGCLTSAVDGICTTVADSTCKGTSTDPRNNQKYCACVKNTTNPTTTTTTTTTGTTPAADAKIAPTTTTTTTQVCCLNLSNGVYSLGTGGCGSLQPVSSDKCTTTQLNNSLVCCKDAAGKFATKTGSCTSSSGYSFGHDGACSTTELKGTTAVVVPTQTTAPTTTSNQISAQTQTTTTVEPVYACGLTLSQIRSKTLDCDKSSKGSTYDPTTCACKKPTPVPTKTLSAAGGFCASSSDCQINLVCIGSGIDKKCQALAKPTPTPSPTSKNCYLPAVINGKWVCSTFTFAEGVCPSNNYYDNQKTCTDSLPTSILPAQPAQNIPAVPSVGVTCESQTHTSCTLNSQTCEWIGTDQAGHCQYKTTTTVVNPPPAKPVCSLTNFPSHYFVCQASNGLVQNSDCSCPSKTTTTTTQTSLPSSLTQPFGTQTAQTVPTQQIPSVPTPSNSTTPTTLIGPPVAGTQSSSCVAFAQSNVFAQGIKRASCFERGGFNSLTCDCQQAQTVSGPTAADVDNSAPVNQPKPSISATAPAPIAQVIQPVISCNFLQQAAGRITCLTQGKGFDPGTCSCAGTAMICFSLNQDKAGKWSCQGSLVNGSTCAAGQFTPANVAECQNIATGFNTPVTTTTLVIDQGNTVNVSTTNTNQIETTPIEGATIVHSTINPSVSANVVQVNCLANNPHSGDKVYPGAKQTVAEECAYLNIDHNGSTCTPDRNSVTNNIIFCKTTLYTALYSDNQRNELIDHELTHTGQDESSLVSYAAQKNCSMDDSGPAHYDCTLIGLEELGAQLSSHVLADQGKPVYWAEDYAFVTRDKNGNVVNPQATTKDAVNTITSNCPGSSNQSVYNALSGNSQALTTLTQQCQSNGTALENLVSGRNRRTTKVTAPIVPGLTNSNL